MLKSEMNNNINIDSQAFVHSRAIIVGQVIVKKHANIWPGAVLRGDMGLIEVGEGTSIQDNCVCHATTNVSKTIIGNRVVVGHGVILHGCQIGDSCLIGMGSIILDNAIIGMGSIVGAGCLISSEICIPNNSLVLGVPGKIKRLTTIQERIDIEHNCQHYIEHIKKYIY